MSAHIYGEAAHFSPKHCAHDKANLVRHPRRPLRQLHSQVREPLTGRTWSHQLYPVSVSELAADRKQYDGQHPSDDFRSSDG